MEASTQAASHLFHLEHVWKMDNYGREVIKSSAICCLSRRLVAYTVLNAKLEFCCFCGLCGCTHYSPLLRRPWDRGESGSFWGVQCPEDVVQQTGTCLARGSVWHSGCCSREDLVKSRILLSENAK